MKTWNAKKAADAVSEAIGLWEGDLVIDEVRTAESREEAIQRLRTVRDDVKRALEVLGVKK